MTQYLIVIDPPHPGPIDLRAVAGALSVIPAEAQALVAARLPIVGAVLADSDKTFAVRRMLASAGVRSAALSIRTLLSAPEPEHAHRLHVEDRGVSWRAEDGTAGELAWHELRAALILGFTSGPQSCRSDVSPPQARTGGWRRELAQGLTGVARSALVGVRLPTPAPLALELACITQQGPRRVRVSADRLVATSIRAPEPTLQGKWRALLDIVESRAPHVAIDRRAADARTTAALPINVRGALSEASSGALDSLLTSPIEFLAAYVCVAAIAPAPSA